MAASRLSAVKQRFFALRNGLLADMLRKQCADPHRMIFGLNLPQLREIAEEFGPDAELARELWADTDVRESRLLAPMLAPADSSALEWLAGVRTPEEADIVCHRLLRRCPGAEAAALKAAGAPEPLLRYAALRLLLNLMPASAATLRALLPTLPDHPLTAGIAAQIRQELDYVDSL